MSLREAEAQAVQFRDQVRAQRGDTGPVNTFASTKESKKTTLASGIVLYTDLSYESKYPNAFFDIWYPDGSGEKRPTVVFFHGGGFLFGDKMEGDPLAVGEASDCTVITELVKSGFNVFSENYALAPEFRFPSQVIQANELFAYLNKAGPELDIFMDDVVIMGSSAGADLTELYGLVVSNPAYVARLGIDPAIELSRIRGLAA